MTAPSSCWMGLPQRKKHAEKCLSPRTCAHEPLGSGAAMRSWGYALPGGLLKGGSFLRPERCDSLPPRNLRRTCRQPLHRIHNHMPIRASVADFHPTISPCHKLEDTDHMKRAVPLGLELLID